MQGWAGPRANDRDALFATMDVWLLYHWGSGSHT